MLERIKVLIDQEVYDEAFDLLEQHLDEHPKDLDYLYLKADLLKRLQRVSDAVNQYTHLLEMYPDEKKAQIERELIHMIMVQENNDKFESTNMYDDPWL